ncbi:MAG: hypothetical protein R2710_13390 [Acidimicrobiales bacterium]
MIPSALRWAARFEGLSNSSAILGESDLAIAMALALMQTGMLADAEAQLQWAFDDHDAELPDDRVHTNALAVGAVVASAMGRYDVAEDRAAAALAGEPTYLDRLLAHLSRAAASSAQGRPDGMRSSIASAREVLAHTDDRISPLLVSLVEAIASGVDTEAVEQEIIAMGIDPTGWRRSWTLASRPGASEPTAV